MKQSKFFCFSPPVMLATFVIEVGLLVYVLFRYKMTALTRLSSILLGCLAIFQLAEYNVCGGLGASAATWSRLGYVAIALLPALGLHLAHLIAGKGMNRVTLFGYASAAAWIGLFSFSSGAFSGHVCAGNYVIFQLTGNLGGLFFLYYHALLALTMWLCVKFAHKAKQKVRNALTAQVVGYATFLIPTGIVNMFEPSTITAIPSIMCGFAVLFALCLSFGVMPLVKERAQQAKARTRLT